LRKKVNVIKESRSFPASPDLVNLVNLVNAAANDHNIHRSEYEADWEKIYSAIEREDERDTRGIVKTITGVGLLGFGILCIFGTAGAATPIVAGLGIAAGSGSAVFGFFDTVEGSQYIYCGRIGDTVTRAWNPLLDGAFHGNDANYNVVETVFGIGTSIMTPIGAVSKATVPTMSTIKYTTAKTLTSMAAGQAAGAGGEEIAKINGADDRTATLIGLGAGTIGGWAAEGAFDYKLFHGDNPSNIDLAYKERTERVKQYNSYKDEVTKEYVSHALDDYAYNKGLKVSEIDKTTREKLNSEFRIKAKKEMKVKKDIEKDTIRHLEDSDNRMREAGADGFDSKKFYDIVTKNKNQRSVSAYEDALEGTKIKAKFYEKFLGGDENKAVIYQSKYAYDNFSVKNGEIGRKEGAFVLPESVANEIEAKLNSIGGIDNQNEKFLESLAGELGLPQDAFKDGVARLDVPINMSNLHMVNGTEQGANAYWIPGGKTLGGIYEGKVDQITKAANPDAYESIIRNAKGVIK